MADVRKNIILSFQVEGQGIEDTITNLEKAGKLGTDAANAIRTGFQKVDAETKEGAQSIEALKKKFQEMIKIGGADVKLGIADELVRLGFTAEDATEFIQQLGTETEKTGKKVVSSKQQLKAMREELIQLSIQGKTNTDRFRQLSAEAGHLEDTIGDVTKTVKHLGSDTHVFDGLIGAATGIAGAFSVAQGATALFGSENEALNETLKDVNGAMAILQGLQAIQNTLQKDSAASLLFLREAKTADVVATEAQTVATAQQTIGTNIAAAAQKALSVIMALSNPITLAVVAAIVAVTAVYKLFTADAKKAAEAQEQFNLNIAEGNKLADVFADEGKKDRDRALKDLAAQGEKADKIRAVGINKTIKLLSDAQTFENSLAEEGNKAQIRLATQRGNAQNAEQIKRDQETSAQFEAAKKRTSDFNDELHDLQVQDIVATGEEISKAKKEQSDKDAKAAEQALTDNIARLKRILLETQDDPGSIGDILGLRVAETNVIKAEALLASFHAKTQDQLDLIKAQADRDIADLVDKYRIGQAKLDDVDKNRTENLRQTNLKVLDGTIKTNAAIVDETAKSERLQEAIRKAAQKKRNEELAKVTGIIAGQLSAAAQSLGTFFDQQAQQQLDGIERQKDAVKELQDAGEITEKEAIIRNRRLDQQAKKIQTEQAKRQKAIAIFEAIVNGAAAVTKALAEGGVILAVAVGIIAAAQVALIASKPIPKFRAGKPKGGFEGVGMIGEAGPEFHESGGRMLLATEPTVTYLRRNDRVFNARETAELISAAPQMNRQYQVYQTERGGSRAGMDIDYKRFGQEVGSHVHNTAVNLTEKGLYTLAQKNGDFYKYLNARRGL